MKGGDSSEHTEPKKSFSDHSFGTDTGLNSNEDIQLRYMSFYYALVGCLSGYRRYDSVVFFCMPGVYENVRLEQERLARPRTPQGNPRG